jgi:hypothetical protein
MLVAAGGSGRSGRFDRPRSTGVPSGGELITPRRFWRATGCGFLGSLGRIRRLGCWNGDASPLHQFGGLLSAVNNLEGFEYALESGNSRGRHFSDMIKKSSVVLRHWDNWFEDIITRGRIATYESNDAGSSRGWWRELSCSNSESNGSLWSRSIVDLDISRVADRV